MNSTSFQIILDKIISSKSFGRSDTYANLLRYLAKCSIEGNVPKETTIASEIFGKPEFDPSQSTLIRVYVYNLRKKLKNYYQNEGIEDQHLVHIPKGSYGIEIIDREDEVGDAEKASSSKKLILPLALFTLVSLFAILYFSSKNEDKSLINQNGLWKDLIESKKPTVLVLGDLFIYNELDTVQNLARTVRDPIINSQIEFDNFKDNYDRPNTEVEPLTYTHLILGSAQWIKQLTEIFASLDSDYSIQTISRFNPKQLQDYDLIVVGMQKTLGVFKSYSQNTKITYDADTDSFVYTEENGANRKVYAPTGDADSYHTDYGYMLKFQGPNNNSIYIFAGIWDTGATQSLKNFTDSKLLLKLEDQMKTKFGKLPENYEVLFEVNGIDRMELSSKILHLIKL